MHSESDDDDDNDDDELVKERWHDSIRDSSSSTHVDDESIEVYKFNRHEIKDIETK